MKIAVSANGEGMEAQVDPRFGRADGFTLVDTDSGTHEYLPNTQNLQAAQGAGIQAAKLVVDCGAEVVISGHCGPKAYRALDSAKVKIVVGGSGTVKEAVDAFVAGKLKPAESADVESHW